MTSRERPVNQPYFATTLFRATIRPIRPCFAPRGSRDFRTAGSQGGQAGAERPLAPGVVRLTCAPSANQSNATSPAETSCSAGLVSEEDGRGLAEALCQSQ